MRGACRAAGTGIRAPPLVCGLCLYYESEMSVTLKILLASQMGKEGSDLIRSVRVVWPRAFS